MTVDGEERPRWLLDALGERHALEGWLTLIDREAIVRGDGCALTIRTIGRGAGITSAPPRPVETEQSNTSVVYGESCILKIVRKLEEGRAPDLEMSEFLTRGGYVHAPRLLAAIELERPASEAATLGVLHEFVPNAGDAWTFALATIARSADSSTDAREARQRAGEMVRRIATRIAEMHTVLASPTLDPHFAPEPIEHDEREALGREVLRSLDAAWATIERPGAALPSDAIARLLALRGREAEIRACVARFVDCPHPCVKTRVHGDLHLGQVLVAGDDFVLIDFEGEPARALGERKAKRSPVVDVSGMLRSLHYASVATWRTKPTTGPRPKTLRAVAEEWYRSARREFLRSYFDSAAAGSVLPKDTTAREVLLKFYLLEKCAYELHYEMNNRPEWVTLPALGLESLIETRDAF